MKKTTKIIVGITAIVIILIAFLIWIKSQEESYVNKVVYVDTMKVFEKFQMKKELDRIIEKDMMQDSQRLDSLGRVLDGASKNKLTPVASLEILKQQYVGYKEQLDEKFQKLSADYTNQVYERLNMYMEEFGKTNGIRMIIGGNEQGTVMYVDKTADLTEDVIVYVNKKYLDN
jgi:outer membrane protein